MDNTILTERPTISKIWRIQKFNAPEDKVREYFQDPWKSDIMPYEIVEFEGNLLLNEGIAELLLLLTGGAGTPFNTANSSLGVGDSSTAESAAHTGLQAATNKVYVAVESGYPSIASQTVTWRSIFGTSVGNFAWNEFTVANGASDAADNLNRKVSAQGTKASGQTWTLDLAITFS